MAMKIGKFILVPTEPGKLWITDEETGEGGQFETAKLAKLVAKFFAEEF